MKNVLSTTLVATLGLTSWQVSLAQSQNAAGSPLAVATKSEKRMIEEVVVTARRTEESQQSVPVAITAFSGEALGTEQISNLQDLQGRIPSLSISANSQQRSTESPTIRGQGGTFGASPGVVTYYAEVPIPSDFPFSGQGGPGKFFDVSNLQVLKGSQGTLFGRNTTGGAMLIEPRRPENNISGFVTGAAGNYDSQTIEGVINIPIIDDKLLMRAGISSVERRGFTFDEAHDKWLDDKNHITGRFSVSWNINERTDNYFLAYYTHTDTNGTGLIIEDVNQEGINYGLLATAAGIAGVQISPVADLLIALGIDPNSVTNIAQVGCIAFAVLSGSPNCGQDVEDDQKARGNRRNETSLSPSDEVEIWSVIDHFNYQITENLLLRNILSYSEMWHIFNWDADGSRLQLQDLATPDGYKAYDISQITEEIQLQGSAFNDRLQYVLGAYYQTVKPEGPQGQQITAFSLVQPIAEFTLEQKTYAPYAQGTYDLAGLSSTLEGLSLTIGARYTTDIVDGSLKVGDGDTQYSSQRYQELTYTAGLDYMMDDNLIYAKVSTGYKAGGFSPTAADENNRTYKPEYVTTFELGQKSDLSISEMPTRINTSLYHTTYQDMQRTTVDTKGTNIGAAVFEAGGATIYGFEFEGIIEPTEWLRLALNYANTQASYDEFELTNYSANLVLDCSGEYITQGNKAELSCAPFQYTPENQYSFTGTVFLPVPSQYGVAAASLSYVFVDEMYSSAYSLPSEEPGAWLESFGLVNASLSWQNLMGSNFNAMLFATNITDEEYRISNSNTWNLVYYRSSIYGEPRMYGANITYNWSE